MNLKEALSESNPSRSLADQIVIFVGDHQSRFDELFELVVGSDKKIASRASWVAGHCLKIHPNMGFPQMERIVSLLESQETSEAVKRNFCQYLQRIDFNEEFAGRIYNQCFKFLNNPDEGNAVRVYAMTILVNICETEPSLADEVLLSIRLNRPTCSQAFRSRANKEIPRLKKIK